MIEMDDPFAYNTDFVKQKEREERRKKREEKLGRPLGQWGGYRPGAGRPKVRKYDATVGLDLNPIQKKLLKEMGKGSIQDGVQKLINDYL